MYRILVVDDEAVVREGMRDNMNWGELGFEFVGDCENGSEAMEAIDKLQPDVVLTDINMPFVDGLELTRYVVEKYPRIKVVILTGYDEFGYAQQAVKLKAYDYILKPITARELRKVLEKLRGDLEEEARKMEDMSRLKMQLRESLPLLKERFLNRLVTGQLREGSFEEKLQYFDIDFKGSCFLALLVDADDDRDFRRYHPGTEDELLLFAIYNISDEIVGNYGRGIVFQNNHEKTVVILQGESRESLLECAARVSEDIREAVEKYLIFTVTVGVGTVCSSLKDLKDSYGGALSALDYRFLLGKNRVITIGDIEGNMHGSSPYNKEWEKKLISGIKTGTVQEIDVIIGNIIKSLRESHILMDRCYIHIQQVIISTLDALNELGVSEAEMQGNDNSPLTDIYRHKTLEEVEVWLRKFCKKASYLLSNKRDSFSRQQALKAVEYITGNYMNESLSLQDVCRSLSMSTSYFSTVFKNFTGETFVEYLTKVRVEKARELLKGSDLKTYEIAHRVGYGDPHYFSLSFKKATGMTPTEYRERM